MNDWTDVVMLIILPLTLALGLVVAIGAALFF
jgi:hypothetical protein